MLISGMQFKLQKTAGLAMCWFTKLKAACISDRRWQRKSLILSVGFPLHKVNWQCKP